MKSLKISRPPLEASVCISTARLPDYLQVMVRLKQLRYVSASTEQNLFSTAGMTIHKLAHIIHL